VQVRLTALKDELSELEEECVEVLQELLKEFDRNYSELAEINKGNYNHYFTQVGNGALCMVWNDAPCMAQFSA